MIELWQIIFVFRKDIVEYLFCGGGGVYERVYGEGHKRLVICTAHGGFDGELLVGFHILQKAADF